MIIQLVNMIIQPVSWLTKINWMNIIRRGTELAIAGISAYWFTNQFNIMSPIAVIITMSFFELIITEALPIA